MQEKDSATTKGPGAIMGVRTKNKRFSWSSESNAAVAPDTFWVYPDADVHVSKRRAPVKGRDWTRVDGLREVRRVDEIAKRHGISMLVTQTPPPKGS